MSGSHDAAPAWLGQLDVVSRGDASATDETADAVRDTQGQPSATDSGTSSTSLSRQPTPPVTLARPTTRVQKAADTRMT